MKIQGSRIDCPTSDVAEATKAFYDGMNRSVEECFQRMGIDITKIGSMFNQLLNFGDENLSKLVKVASEGVDELLGNEEPIEVETASTFTEEHYSSKPWVMLIFDQQVDPRLMPLEDKQYGMTFEYISEAQEFLDEVSKGIGMVKVTTTSDEAELPLISRGSIRIDNPKIGNKLHRRSIRWRIEKI